jgi:alpha-L-rhamnosidase
MNPDPEKPGYRHIIFKPRPAGDLNSASYANRTSYGDASISWETAQGTFNMEISVPVGCTATVYVPAEKAKKVKEGNKKASKSTGIISAGASEGYAVFRVGSGYYLFSSPR